MESGLTLGVDFGTSNTVAVLGAQGRPARHVLFEGSHMLPSGVYADGSGLVTGLAAIQAARADPDRYEPHPKSRIAEETIELGMQEYPPVDLVTAVFARVWEEATRVADGVPIVETVITHPDDWGKGRMDVLRRAAHQVGMVPLRLVAEPVAAAAYLSLSSATPTQAVGSMETLDPGKDLVVYDLGAGTFDTSVISQTAGGLEVRETGGLEDVGGLFLDEAIKRHLGVRAQQADSPAWEKIIRPTTKVERRNARHFMEEVRAARESLSTVHTTQVPVPNFEEPFTLTRAELETLAEPILERTATRVQNLIRDAALANNDIDRILLVGGASRTPLVATILERRLHIRTMLAAQPEMVVVEGSVTPMVRHHRVPAPAPVRPSVEDGSARDGGGHGDRDSGSGHHGGRGGGVLPPGRRLVRPVLVTGAVLLVAAATVLVLLWRPWSGGVPLGGPSRSSSVAGGLPLAGDGVLRIGSLLPLTGGYVDLNEGTVAAFDLAVKDVNDAGGVLGRKVETVPGDEGERADVTTRSLTTLLGRDVDVVVGPTSSALTLGVLDQSVAAGVVMISPSNTALRLTGYHDAGLYFRTAPPDDFQGEVLADLVVRDGHAAVGMLVLDDEYGRGLAGIIRAALERGHARVAKEVRYPPGEPDFAPKVAGLKGVGLDAIVMIGFGEAEKIIRELVRQGMGAQSVPWYLVDGNLGNYGDSLPPGTMVGTKGTLPGAQVTGEFLARLYAQKAGLRNVAFAPETYDAVVLAALAATAAGSDHPGEVAKQLGPVSRGGQKCTSFTECRDLLLRGEDIDYDGLCGAIDLNGAGDPTIATIGIFDYLPDNTYKNIEYKKKVI